MRVNNYTVRVGKGGELYKVAVQEMVNDYAKKNECNAIYALYMLVLSGCARIKDRDLF